MKAIWKFPLEADSGIIKAPITKILTAQYQKEILTVWAEVDTNIPIRTYKIYVIGTGWPFETDNLNYINTLQDGPYVWHIYWGDGANG